ncbi:MAG: UvrD-helicase domain-containing protein [Lacunisphaera sp.]|nr:UvrD-helicase domain-containing protein [Lacunisphaera sp.]
MKPAGHVMILASAGSGKTYALTNRFVELLARGAKPERIAALTFTRKAAGEFFDEILKKLAGAARDEAAAKKLAAEIGVPALRAGDFLRLLRAMTDAMHRLSLGTLDSFFARVVRAFPLELGLGGEFEILQEHAARLERRRVLRRMFAHTDGGGARQDFIEAFKRATFGTEEKQLGVRLDAFLDEHAEVYLAAPDAAAWGRAERIWPGGCAWLAAAAATRRTDAAKALQAALPWETLADKQRARWEDFFAELPGWAPGAPLPKPVAYIVGNGFAAWPGLAEITVERKRMPLSPAAGNALRALLGGIVGAELARRLEMTQGMFAVLRSYEDVYDGAVRRGGRLTFADVQRLLRPDTPGGARMLSREAAEEARLFIDWRLDAQIDHWLLDEFQDTSFGQWSVLRNLVDEAVQDPTGARSFFYVGDVKQAIYAWREGDARLFREIFDHYNAEAPGTIREERLDRSWRSGPAVIALVNRTLGDAEALRRLFPAAAVARWAREWREHESAQPALGGFAELRHAADETGRFAATLRIVTETQALERGLSVAVLVQKNSTAAELADYLRREGGLSTMAESDLHVGTDNPFTCALLALCRAAAHPGDEAAWQQLKMTPLAAVLAAEGCATSDALAVRLLGEIHAAGFERTIEAWARKLAPEDAFSRERGRQLAEAARLFDETGSRDVAEFGQFVARHTVRDADTAAVVRVMTVHKAKGLGFDVVILPDLEGTRLAARRRGLAVQRARDRSVEWVLDLPPETFYAPDQVLAAHVAAAEADAGYEELAVLYVAMTRAKRALYVVTEPVGTSKSANFPRLLQETLGDEWTAGDPQWFEKISAPALPAETAAAPSGPDLTQMKPVGRRPARAPSGLKGGVVTGARLFALDGGGAVDFGRAVHALFAQVEWGGAAEAAQFEAKWRGVAARAALACLRAADLAPVWARPAGAARAEVWRERAFELVHEGGWVTGVLDRVVVEYDHANRVVRAAVYDFKTDADEAAGLARHAGQMNLYRLAVARLTGLSLAQVGVHLVLTGSQRSLPVSMAD